MKKYTIATSISSLALVVTVLAPTAAFAQTDAPTAQPTATPVTTTVPITVVLTAKQQASVTKAEQEIDRRVAALDDLATRVQQMQKVTDAFKQSLVTSIQAQVSALTTLRAKIAADTDAATLKTDIQSITDSYRVYALVLPQARIATAGDRVMALVDMMTALGTKFQQRIASAQSAGGDVSALSAALSDLGAKLLDASAQARAGVSVSASLVPDGGDKAKLASNTTALKASRSDIQTAQKDIQTGEKDIKTILAGLQKIASTTLAVPTPSAATSTTR